LAARDTPADALSLEKDVDLKIVTTLAVRISDSVDLVDDLDEALPVLVVICALDHDLALRTLPDLCRSDLSLHVYCLLDEPSGILLYQHELDHVQLLIFNPVFIKLLQYASDLVDQLDDCLVALLLADALVGLLGVVEELAEVLK
jgi:hypothetical protein